MSPQISSLPLVWIAEEPCCSYPAGSWCGSSGTWLSHLGAPGLLPMCSLCMAPTPARLTLTSQTSGLAGTADCSSSPAGGPCTACGAYSVFWGLYPPGWGLHYSVVERSLNWLLPLPWLEVRIDSNFSLCIWEEENVYLTQYLLWL